MRTTTILREGLGFGEGPRWHEGRLWFSDFYRRGVYSIDATGADERLELEVPTQPSGLGWTPEGDLVYASMTDAFAGAGVTLAELRADGGAAVMDLLCELQASASRLAVARSGTLEATARGAASVAALGAGLVDSLEQLAGLWEPAARFAPRPGEADVLDAAYAAWRREALRA